MKKIYFILAVLAVLASSCSKENICNEKCVAVNGTLTAYTPSCTKTAFGEKEDNVTKMVWSAGDALWVAGETTWPASSQYTLVSEPSDKGTFQSTKPLTETGGIGALYPYSWCSRSYSSPYYIAINIPEQQNPSTIGKGIMPMYGKGTQSGGLKFQHLGAILRFRLFTQQAGLVLNKIELKNINPITGRLYIEGYDKQIKYAWNASNTLTYIYNQPLHNDKTDPSEIDVLVLCPINGKALNLTMTLTFNNGTTFTRSMSSNKTINSGSIVTFSTLECCGNEPSVTASSSLGILNNEDGYNSDGFWSTEN